MLPRPPRSTRTDTLCPDTTRFRSPARLQEGAHVVGLVVGHVAQVQEQFGHAPFYSATRTGRRAHALSGRRLPPPGASPTGSRGQEISRSESASSTTFRSEEHTSELQSLMRISYAVFCLKKKK